MTFREIFCGEFSTSLALYCPRTEQKSTFYADLEQKVTVFEAFGNFKTNNGVKSALLVGLRQNKTK